MNDGLTTFQRECIREVLAEFPQVERAVLFGSRAMGTWSPASDVDLALFGDALTLEDEMRIAARMEDLGLPVNVDLVRHATIQRERLQEHIARHGKPFYDGVRAEEERDSKGFTFSRGWTDATVDDIKASTPNALATGPFGSSIGSRFFQDHGVPVIRGSNLSGDIGIRLVEEDLVFLAEEKAQSFERSVVERGDLVFTCWGTIGQVGLIDDRARFPRYVVSNKQMKLTPDPTKADSLFLYYLFSSPLVSGQIKGQSIGSSVPGFNLGQLRKIQFRIPNPCTQRAIARILGTLDDKIALNRAMNETLEAMARAIFQSWFVNFDPVHAKARGDQPAGMSDEIAALFPSEFEDSELGLIPKGWQVIPLDKAANFLNGLAMQKYPPGGGEAIPVIKIAQLRDGSTANSDQASSSVPNPYLVRNGDLLFSWSGSLEVRFWFGGIGALNQHLFKVTSKVLPHWLLYQWLMVHLPNFRRIASYKATTMGHIQRQHLSAALVVVPPPDVLREMDYTLSSLNERTFVNSRQEHSLAAIRDALLPRLISGKLRVGIQCPQTEG